MPALDAALAPVLPRTAEVTREGRPGTTDKGEKARQLPHMRI